MWKIIIVFSFLCGRYLEILCFTLIETKSPVWLERGSSVQVSVQSRGDGSLLKQTFSWFHYLSIPLLSLPGHQQWFLSLKVLKLRWFYHANHFTSIKCCGLWLPTVGLVICFPGPAKLVPFHSLLSTFWNFSGKVFSIVPFVLWAYNFKNISLRIF